MARHFKHAQVKRKAANPDVADAVRAILDEVAEYADAAVARYAVKFDRWEGGDFRVDPNAVREAERNLPETFKDDFAYAHRNVSEFARRQRDSLSSFEFKPEDGIVLGQRVIPVARVGCYVPGGNYPLVASAIMSIATAKVAGVDYVVAAAPPKDGRNIHPASLYAMHHSGADEIYAMGGVQALAAMAYGCLGIRPVDMIVGAGNRFVAEAKRQLFGTVGIDLLAGPTEILVIADDTADPALVATDLLGQAEHGEDSPAWLVTTSETLARAVCEEIDRQLPELPTRAVAERAWQDHGEIVLVDSREEAVAVADDYAPEHLELMTADDDWFLTRLRNYGSLFIGQECTVTYGDKGVGTNHTLPTARAARYTGGLSAAKFLKTVTYQRLDQAASARMAPVISRICEIEGMWAHKKTADVRAERYASTKSA
jgi:sulfopropanediol 3-dehydrogenase